MTDNTNLTVTSQSEDLTSESIFGSPPILDTENPEAYDAMLARVAADAKPQDIFEEIWVRDVVDLTWQSLRWRRMTADHVAYDLEWRGAIEKVELFDRLAMRSEDRRNAALRELERHRSSFAQNLRSAVSEAEQVEFKALEQKSAASSVGNSA